MGHVECVDHFDDIVNLESISSMKIDTLESNIPENIVKRSDYMKRCLNVLDDIKKLMEKTIVY